MSALADEITAAVQLANAPLLSKINELETLVKQSLSENDDPFFTVAQAAKLLKCSEKTIHRKFGNGRSEIKRVGRKILIPREAVLSVQSPS